MPKNKFDNKNILVTGGAGFIGNEVVSILDALGAKVTVLDDLSSGASSNLSNNIRLMVGDIHNFDTVKKAMEGNEIVFHLAARPFVPYSYNNPRDVLETNVIGSANIALACVAENIQLCVCISSSEVYGSNSLGLMSEDSPTEPFSTYAVAKLAGERVCFSISKEHQLPLIIVRPFNTYGPKDNHPRIIPTIISQLHRNNFVKLGNPNPIRDLTYVTDTARGIIDISSNDKAIGQIINVGTSKGYSPKELVKIISSLMGKDNIRIESDNSLLRPHDPHRMLADCRKVQSMVGWKPKVSIEKGLSKTIDWYISAGSWSWEKEKDL
tara:strand:+ start:1065 stop:2036 length:972 start_codon:yes stop_codon:yes gene_type:complete